MTLLCLECDASLAYSHETSDATEEVLEVVDYRIRNHLRERSQIQAILVEDALSIHGNLQKSV